MSNNIESELISFMSNELGIEGVSSTSRISDLDIDSLVFIELSMMIERKFHIELEANDLLECDTTNDIAKMCERRKLNMMV